MILFRLNLILFLAFYSLIGQATHPFCLHPLYQAATGQKFKGEGQQLNELQKKLLNPFFMMAILQKPSPEDDEPDVYPQVVHDLRQELRYLAMKKVWFKLSRSERKALRKNTTFSEQIEFAGLKIEDPSNTELFSVGKMEKILKSPIAGIADYSLKDLLKTLLGPRIKQRLYLAIKGVCQNLAPVQLPEHDLSSLSDIEEELRQLIRDNILAFKIFLRENFSRDLTLSPEKFIWEFDLEKLDQLVVLKNILEQQIQEIEDPSKKLLAIITMPESSLQQAALKISTELLEEHLIQLNELLNKNSKILTFFEQQNMHALDEFIHAHKIRFLHIPAQGNYQKAQSLFFSNPEQEAKFKSLAMMKQFMTAIDEQLKEQNIPESYIQFFRRYYSYSKSLDLIETKLEQNSQIAADKNICTILGLPFPCFDKIKIAKLRLSRSGVSFLVDEDYANLSTHIAYHLNSLSEFILFMLDYSSRIGEFSEHLLEIQRLVTLVHRPIKGGKNASFEEYLPTYNNLLAKVYSLRRIILSKILQNQTNSPISQEEAAYLKKRISHLL